MEADFPTVRNSLQHMVLSVLSRPTWLRSAVQLVSHQAESDWSIGVGTEEDCYPVVK